MRDRNKRWQRLTRKKDDFYLLKLSNTGTTALINHGNSTPDIKGEIIDQLGKLEDMYEAFMTKAKDPSMSVEKATKIIKERLVI